MFIFTVNRHLRQCLSEGDLTLVCPDNYQVGDILSSDNTDKVTVTLRFGAPDSETCPPSQEVHVQGCASSNRYIRSCSGTQGNCTIPLSEVIPEVFPECDNTNNNFVEVYYSCYQAGRLIFHCQWPLLPI